MRSGNIRVFFIAMLLTCVSAMQAKADVINVSVASVPPELAEIILEAEAVWEERIQAVSTELPLAIRLQLTQLQITSLAFPIDGPGGILAFAGPDTMLDFQPTNSLVDINPVLFPLSSTMVFDVGDSVVTNEDERRQLLETAVHELAHCFGFGTVWAFNGFIGQNATTGGLTQYIGGEYALAAYRTAINNPVAPFVPLEQGGGPGSALSHWARVPALDFPEVNEQDVMLAFAGFFDEDGELVIPVNRVTEITFGAMADIGFAVSGINGQFAAPPGTGTGTWPKITGIGGNPFAGNAVNGASTVGLTFRTVNLRAVYNMPSNSGEAETEVGNTDAIDPYNLRDQRWNR